MFIPLQAFCAITLSTFSRTSAKTFGCLLCIEVMVSMTWVMSYLRRLSNSGIFFWKERRLLSHRNRADEASALEEREKTVADCLWASDAEQWQINPAIHYNKWANLTAADFTPVVKAFHDLVQEFFCDKEECKSLYHLSGTSAKNPDTLRCMCGDTNINLTKK